MFRLFDPHVLLLAHTGLTAFMTGLIWFVQVVHYPLFGAVGRSEFGWYEAQHVRRVSWVVGPVMLAEAISGVGLLLVDLPVGMRATLWGNVVLLLGIWLSTALWQVPQHERLRGGFDGAAVRRLVNTNWARTAAWTMRGLVLGWVLMGV